jgi:hypothetical protein
MKRKLETRGGFAGVAFVSAALVFATPALAEPTAADKANADGLFTEALQLLEAGRATEACPKLEESQRLDATIGTALNLGDCYERVGRTASAYVAFGDAATLARRSGDTARAEEANRRADVLQPKLVRLAVNVPESSRLQGLAIVRDGQPVAPTLWGTPIPVDPGEHVVEAKAPERVPWKTTLKLDVPGTTGHVAVPLLGEIQHPPPPGKPTQRIVGIVIGSVGLAALSVSLGFSIASIRTDDASKAYCLPNDPNKCYSEGVVLRKDAITYSHVATVLTSAGGVFLATGVMLYLLGRPGKSPEKPKSGWVVVPQPLPRGAGLTIGGVF